MTPLRIFTLILFPCCVLAQTKDFSTSQKDTAAQKIGLSKIDSAKFIKLKPFHFITNVPGDILQIAEAPFKKNNLRGLISTVCATALLIPLDQNITNGEKKFARQLNIYPDANYKTLIKVGKTNVFKVPKNINASLYQLGEGGTSMMIAGGLYVYSKITQDERSLQAAGDLSETFLTMGITTQIIKRISGRQSPFKATANGGEWHFLPTLHNYQNNTGNYDAFPSGHLASMMATVSMLVLDYPEKKWIKPTGIGLMCLTGSVMLLDDVHWVSDYPLALALGYLSAKITYIKNHRKIAGSNIHPIL